ncbi:hypothetical protein ID866_7650 [Astraeus odoratus]|nr:hypothetical protein ID866_7650 [Astraeus odoratus]
MVDRAQSLIALFDGANVRRWRVVVTLPATEEGIRAAAIVTHKYSIQTNLSLVSCLPHASACLEAGARVITISLRGVLEWYEKQQKLVPRVTTDHPGIEAVQMCVSYILRHKLNTILMAADIRSWLELKQLSGIGAAALTQQQLDQIPMRTLATWFPRTDDTSRSTQQVREAPYPTRYLDAKKGFFLSLLPAECRSLVSAVLYVRLGEMSTWMEQITAILREEVRYRIELMSMDLRGLYQHRRKDRNHGSGEGQRPPMRRLRSSSSLASVRDGDQGKQEGYSSSPAGNTTAPMIEGVDYF